jgi:uncharacterized OB-fold protein
MRPLPIIDDDNRPFWEGCKNRKLLLQQCDACSAYRYYPGAVCSNCGALEHTWKETTGQGSVYTFSVVYRAASPAFIEDVPYVYAIIELKEGPMFPTNIVGIDPKKVHIGMPVRVDFRQITPEITLPVFGPT